MRIAAIIPVLDEAERLGGLLQVLAALDVDEVIVVDGGSSDGTAERAARFPKVRVLAAARGRAVQMNTGAARTNADVLWFLHADTLPPTEGPQQIRVALSDPAVVAGAFRIWTVPDAGRNSRMAPLLHLADLRSRYTSLPYGDQGVFVRAEAFREVGGYPDQPLMEDLEMSRRLRRLGRIRTLPASVTVSGRRFLARPLYYTLLVNAFPLLYRLGVPPGTLKRWYHDVR